MIIDDYFSSIERGLRQNAQVSEIEEPFVCLASDDCNGLVRCRIFFWDGSYLDLYEAVSTELVLGAKLQGKTDLSLGFDRTFTT